MGKHRRRASTVGTDGRCRVNPSMQLARPPAGTKSLCCPSSHHLTPTTLRFYQGFVHSRSCNLCAVTILREETRHSCDRCNYNVCLRCVEKCDLQRVQARLVKSPSNQELSAWATAVASSARLEHAPSLCSVEDPAGNGSPRLEEASDDMIAFKGGGDQEARMGKEASDYMIAFKSGEDQEARMGKYSSGNSFDSSASMGQDNGGNGLAGRGLLAIPEAAPSPHLRFDRPFTAALPKAYDLRRFIRPGDILNHMGGNAWGHTVLALSTPRVVHASALFAAEPPHRKLAMRIPAYNMWVLQSASNMLEIKVCRCVLVVHPGMKAVCPVREVAGGLRLILGRDRMPVITEVLMSPMSNSDLDLDTFRLAVEEVQRAPQDLKWSFTTALRSYFRDANIHLSRCQTRDAKKQVATEIRNAWLKRPVCSTVPPRVWQKYFLKMSQRKRKALPATNGAGSPLERGSGPGGHLLYCGRVLIEAPAKEAWTAPARRQHEPPARATLGCCGPNAALPCCGPSMGLQCGDCLSCQWASLSDDPDSEVAWVEDILRFMPVKDDRVLPRELTAILLETRLWQQLDFDGGPPWHRRGDEAPPSKEGCMYNRPWKQLFTRAELPAETRNGNGAPVHLGQNGFTVYCGQQFSKPQELPPRFGRNTSDKEEMFQWDGNCGPELGPQCPACRSLEDALLA